MTLQNRKSKMNFKHAVTSVIFFSSLALGFSTNVNAQTGPGPATNQISISQDRQLAASSLSSRSAVAEPAKTEPAPIVRELKNQSAVDDSNTENAAKSATVPPGTSANQWHIQFTPYLWVVGVSGRAGIGTFTTQVDSGVGDDNVHLNFGFMGTFEVRRKKFAVVTDLEYANLGTERPTPGPLFSNATADFKAFILDPEVAYRIAANPDTGTFIDVLGGVRYWHLRADLNFDAGLLSARSATGSKDWADAVIGMRARAAISRKLFVLGKADVGGGGSKFTYQLFAGAGFKVGNRTNLVGGYRYLRVNYDKDNFLFDGSLAGPIIGVSFRLK
jgi:hypothetical protein